MSESGASAALLQRMCSAARAEACAAAERLVAIGELVSLRLAQDADATELWVVDATDAVTLEVAAALGISRDLAASHVRYAHALRFCLPRLGRAFIAGDIDEAVFRACVFRTGLIVDDTTLAMVDAELAITAPRWGSCSRSQLAARIDRVVAKVDLDAVRRRRDRVAGRDVTVGDVDNGLTEIHAIVTAPDGHAFDERLTALANTVCDADGRTMAQRRSDAVGALAAGGDRLGCRCGSVECPAAGAVAGAVVIHVIAEQATIDGTATTPGSMVGFEGLIPAEMITELAKAARLRPLVHPVDCRAEGGYIPSRALADFVRCRDLTCRFPGCNAPATRCDLDHTVPHGRGGPTQASNLKFLCRFHHLVKTFWGWSDEQLVDGTIIWTSPAGDRYVTHPGSALVFPGLCAPTAPMVLDAQHQPGDNSDRTAKMPRRRRTRAHQRAHDITAERAANHRLRTTTPTPAIVADDDLTYADTFDNDPSPPPF
ncbi:HNH endonuclease [Mycobacterium hodleri]|uniref:HNH endonuclease n=1 Tax=Mycolicibacterium hodleri TaxID=49897 RepID=A0A544W4L1_9MYCO|nr:HNH endonuclease signature motif containing protein [Mycolicibacterium hodleri]TQR87174.1 HNH endonuclease [Mycolicibacterium hodleri]